MHLTEACMHVHQMYPKAFTTVLVVMPEKMEPAQMPINSKAGDRQQDPTV